MPEIKNNFQIQNIEKNAIVDLSKSSLESIGGKNIEIKDVGGATNIKSTVPSIWGWGGMNIEVSVASGNDNNVQVYTTGYIAQLSTSPLTKKLDAFMHTFSTGLKNNYNYELTYEKQTGFIKIPKLTFNKMDKTVFIAVLVLTLIPTVAGLFSKGLELLLGGLLVYCGYYFGKNYIYKNKN